MNRRFFVAAFALAVLSGAGLAALHAPATRAQELTDAERAQLQAEYNQLQQEIAAQQQIIAQTQGQERTLKGDVTSLTAAITAAQKQIDAKNIQLRQLASEIATKTETISNLESHIDAGKESLASMLRQEAQLEDASPVAIAFGAESISEFFSDVDSFASIENALHVVFNDLEASQAQAANERDALASTQNQVTDAKYAVQETKAQIATNKTEKQQLLAAASASEAEQQKVLAANQAKAAAIRAALFPLRDAAAIPFGTALQYAQAAQRATGVDPALVLAILTQESNLGANVGQCYLANDQTGAGVGKNSGTAFAKVMNPNRDVPIFLAMANAIGFDPHHQVVSCPIAGAGGWGGAMGPAQFIPSTWKLYMGVSANPWDPSVAIRAMSTYLADLGAGAGGYTALHTAAAKYYAGGAWASAGQAYANQVMAKVSAIQQNITFLAQNS
ncbi:MAG: lytic murein transglycosylase [Patescibacteria group bacterium]|nr:lytic murein transglycosylase [Patescibacteria group bacterium]MDE1944330.1 lytic murein transglycosylase [Patescibacteria group bacterium]MDE1944674.1 lytic murein transglycosylase [Patescibacteria group bacterium]MDE2057360.1 lytic murein transglycosylase [Patescibacteria group bacterium]